MKKTNILLSALTLTAMSITASAQPWGPGGLGSVNTWTASNVGIGSFTAAPTDANLEVKTTVSGLFPTGSPGNIPDLTIHRLLPPTEPTNVFPNHLEIWDHPAASGGTTPPPVLVDVVDPNGWLGILKTTPLAPLHVGGNGIIDGNATVGGNGIITGNATVGTGSLSLIPGDVLTVQNVIGFSSVVDSTYRRGIHGNSTTGGLYLYSNQNYNDGGSGVELWAASNTAYKGQVHFICGGADSNAGFQFINLTNPGYHSYMDINKIGSVVIAGPGNNVESIPTPAGYGLYVGVGILTEKIKVAVHSDGTNWSDFVFNKNYDLMPLSKVESYVKANKHLPEIPSANEVAKDGIDVATMDAKLLQKIEELTLYVIQQQKEIDELKESQNKQ